MSPLITAAFVIAATQFFKTQFGLENKWALLCAFVVSCVVGVAPTLAAAIPAAASYISTIATIIGIFIGSAGSYDFILAVKRDGVVKGLLK